MTPPTDSDGTAGSRSSLREGPLADLFRRTDADVPDGVTSITQAPSHGRTPAEILELSDVEPAGLTEEAEAVEEPVGDGSRGPIDLPDTGPRIRVVGVGGGGTNAIGRMVQAGVQGVEFVAVNTDAQSLQESPADRTIHIGQLATRGLGAGSNPDVGSAAAMEQMDEIKDALRGSDMVFIAAGEGGGTGTGAAPVVARVARELGALTVGIVTRPFAFEGKRRAEAALAGVRNLAEEVDTLIVVPNDKLLAVLDRGTSMVDAFRVADDVLRQGVQGISELVTLPGLINLDFADVRTIMAERGAALLGIGRGTGEQRATQAADNAVSSPLLETSMEGAKAILLSITGGSDLSLWEINEAAEAIGAAAHPEANIIFGANVDPTLGDEVWITVVATAFEHQPHLDEPRDARPSARSQQPSGRPLREPAGEPRVTRRQPRRSADDDARGAFDVPEFLPTRG